ncbi:MAG: hydrolase [Woeseia sp.]|nr:hydrolase [Woeseia sp.]
MLWMKTRTYKELGFIASLLFYTASISVAEDAVLPRIESAECVSEQLRAAGADCYLFFGEENRDKPNGTLVKLPVAVIAPNTEAGNPDPLFFFPGGPGVTPMYDFSWIRADAGNRTVVLIDHRGMLHAKPSLACPGRTISPYQNHLSPVIVSTLDTKERLRMHAETVENCYEKMVSEGIDVTRYNEYEISRDVEEIRQLLGYAKINIYGYSTGGGSIISYLRYFPNSVRTIVLGAPWFGEYRNRPAIDEFYTIKQSFTDILGRCVSEDLRCRELIPDWYYEIDRARRMLDEKPFSTTIRNQEGKSVTLTFDGVALMGRIYTDFEGIYTKLPNVLSRVQKQDYSALDDFFQTDQWRPVSENDFDDYTQYGYYLAHICGDMGTNRPTKADVMAMLDREPALLAFEDNKICAWWGADGSVPPEHNTRFDSDVPGLSLHGEVDVCCTTRWGNYVARTMPNLQVVELSGLGHMLGWSAESEGECRVKLISSFLDNPMTKAEDDCMDDVPLGPWEFE